MAQSFDLPMYARGLRNNNPGNIEQNPNNNWQGAAPTQTDGRFVQFDTPEAGARAMARVLGNYRARGTNTINDIIGTWAPAQENNTAAYVQSVAKQMGVDPTVPLSEAQYPQLMAAITQHENGSLGQFTPDIFQKGWDAAFNGAQLPVGRPAPVPKDMPALSVVHTNQKSLQDMLAVPTTQADQKRQQLGQTTTAKQNSMDPYQNLDTDQMSMQEFLATHSNGDPLYDRELIIGYEKARDTRAATKQAQEDRYWAKTSERGTLTGDLINMAAGVTNTSARIMGEVINNPNVDTLFNQASLASTDAKKAYPVVQQYEQQVAQLEQLRQQIRAGDASEAEKNLRLTKLDQYQAKLAKPTAEQYAALDALAKETSPYGEGMLPGLVKPGFTNNTIYDLEGKTRTNREALDTATKAGTEAAAVRSAFNSVAGDAYNPNYNRDEFMEEVRTINDKAAPELRASLDQTTQAFSDGRYLDSTVAGLQTTGNAASWLVAQAGNAIKHPAAVRDWAVEMSPYLIAGMYSPTLMAGLNIAYGKGVVQTAIADYQKTHNGELPSEDDLTTMMNAGTAAAAMEYLGESGVLKGISQLAGKAVTKTAAKAAAGTEAEQAAKTSLYSLLRPAANATVNGAKQVARKTAPVVESYLKESGTEGVQAYLENDVAGLRPGNPSWGQIAENFAVGGAAGGGSAVIIGAPRMAVNALRTGQGVASKAVEMGAAALNQRNRKTEAQQEADNAAAADTSLQDYQQVVAAVSDAEAFSALDPETQQTRRDTLARTTAVLEEEFNTTLDRIEAEQRQPSAEEATRLKQLHSALNDLGAAYEKITQPTETATEDDISLVTQPTTENTNPEPVVSAAQRVLFGMLQQPETADVSVAAAMASNTQLSEAQRATAEAVPVFKDVMSALTQATSSKGAQEVHSDVLQGTERFKGVLQYISTVQSAITNNDANTAVAALKNLEQFRNRQQTKLAAGYQGGEHRPAFKQLLTTEVAALDLAYAQLSELTLAHLPQLQAVNQQVASQPLQTIQAAIQQARTALASAPAATITPTQAAPVATVRPAAAPTVAPTAVTTPSAATVVPNTATAEMPAAPTTDTVIPDTDPVPDLQQLADSNRTATANTDTVVAEETTEEAETDDYQHGATLLASARPESTVSKAFAPKRTGNLLHRVSNVIRKLGNPQHALHQQAKRMLDTAGYAALGNFIQHADDVIAKLPQMVDLDSPHHDQNNRNNLFEDFVTVDDQGNVQIDENLMAHLAVANYEWLATQGTMTLRNRDEDINKLLGRDGKAPVSSNERKAYSKAGKLANNIVEELGSAIVRQLPLKALATASPQAEAQLRTALGTMAAAALLEQGLLETRWVRATHTKTAAGNWETSRELILGDDVPAKQGDNVVIEKYFRIPSSVQTQDGVTREVAVPAIQDIRAAFKNLKPFLTDLLGARAKEDTVFTDPADIPPYKTDRNGQPLSTRQAEALTTHSQRPHRFKTGMLTLLKALSPLQQAMMLGYHPNVAATVCEARIESVESVNEQIQDELEQLFVAYDDLNEQAFYFQHSVAINKRMHMVSRTVNPQASQLHRHAITMDDQVSEVDWNNAAQQRQFKVAVAEAFGFSVDKHTLGSAVQFFDQLLQDPLVQEGITGAKAILSGDYTNDDVDAALTAVARGEEGVYSLDGLLALARMDETKPFTSDLFRKVDGVTNGTAIGLLQLAGAASYRIIRTMLARTGIFLDSNQTSYGEWYNEPGHNDSYQELTANTVDFIAYTDFHRQWGETLAENQQLPVQRAGIDFFFDAQNFLDSDGKVTKTGRNLAKQPLMTSNYGAAMPSIVAGMTDTLVGNIYTAIEDAVDAKDTTALQTIEQQVQQILGTQAGLFTLDQANPLATVISPRAIRALEAAMNGTYGVALEASMNKEYATQKQHAKLVNDATHLAFEAFKVMYQQALDQKLAAKQETDPAAQITNADVQAVLQELAPVSPIIATALSNQVASDQAIRDGVNFVQRTKVRQVGVTPEEKRANSVKIQTKRLSGAKAGKGRVLTMYTYGEEFKDPGVSPAVLLIQSFDAATMVELLREHGVLNVHDAGIMGSNNTEQVTQDFNKKFLRLHQQYSMLEATQQMLERTLTAYRKQTGDQQLKKLTFQKNAQRNLATQELVTAADFEILFNLAVPQIEENRRQVLSRIQAVVQYNAENGAYVPAADADLTTAQMEEVLGNLDQDIEPDFQPLPLSLTYQSKTLAARTDSLPINTTLDLEQQAAVRQGETISDFVTQLQLHETEFPFEQVLADALQAGATAQELIQVLKAMPDIGPVRQAVLDRMLEAIPDNLDIRVMDTPEQAHQAGGNAAQLVSQRNTGYYTSKDATTGRPTVYLAGKGFRFSGISIQTVMHELFHAVTLVRLHEEAAKPATEQSADFKTLQKLYNYSQRSLPHLAHRMTDIFEFVTEAHTNVAFAQALARLKVNKNGKTTLYSKFVTAIGQLMGLFKKGDVDTNVLFEVMAASDSLYAQRDQVSPLDQPVTAAQRATQFARRMQNVTQNNAQQLFNELTKLNKSPVTGAQQVQLQTVLDTLVPVLTSVKLHLRKQAHGNAVITDQLKERVVVDIGQQAAANGVEMSAQEAYVHGLLKVILDSKLESQHPAARELQRLFDYAEKTLTVQDFLTDPSQQQDPQALAAAQQRYDYLFRSGTAQQRQRRAAYTGTAQEDVYSDHLHAFVAMALTHAPLRQALTKLDARIPQKLQKGNRSSAQWMLELVQGLLSALSLRLRRGNTRQMDGRILELVERLATVDNRHARRVYDAMASAQESLGEGAEKVIATATQALGKLAASAPVKNSKVRVVRTAGKATDLVLNGNGPALVQAMEQTLQRTRGLRRGLLASTIQEMAGNTEKRRNLYRLLQKRVKMIDILRHSTLTKYSKYLTKSYQQPLSQEDCAAITRVGLRTDLDALVQQYGMARTLELIRNPQALQREIAQQVKQVQAQPNGVFYAAMADNLGYFMVSMQSKKVLLLRNAHAIAQLAGTGRPAPKTDPTAVTAQIDILASLYAQKYLDPQEQQRFLAIAERELDPNDMDNQNSGLAVTLHAYRNFKQDSLAKLFHNNPMLMQKGYVRETFDPRVQIVVADATEGAELEKLGYTKGAKVVHDPASMGVLKRDVYYYSIENSGDTRYKTGVLSLTGTNHRGTDLQKVQQQAGVLDPALASFLEAKLIQKNKQAAIDDLFITGGKDVTDAQAVQVLDEQGNVANHVYLMAEEQRRNWKKRNDDFRHVLGTTIASLGDKVESQALNREIMDSLFADYKANYAKEKHRFVAVSATSPDKEFQQAFRLLSADARQYAQQLWGNKVMYIREDQFQLLFGYRPLAISQLRYDDRTDQHGTQRMLQLSNNMLVKMLNNRIGRTASLVWRELAHMAKDTIVIKSLSVTYNNVLSNLFLLKMHGVPVKYILRDTAIAYRSAIEYQRQQQELFEAEQELSRGAIGDRRNALLHTQRKLKNQLRINPVRELMEEGVLQSIVEDVDTVDDIYNYEGRVEEQLNKLGDYVPEMVKSGAKLLTLHHSTTLYKLFRDFAMLSDFSARYVLHKHNTQTSKKPMSVAESIEDVMEAFVNYEVPTHKAIQFLNDHDPVMFTKYLLRTQKVIFKLLKRRPAELLMMAVMQRLFGDVPDVTDSLLSLSALDRFIPSPTSLLDGLTDSVTLNALTH